MTNNSEFLRQIICAAILSVHCIKDAWIIARAMYKESKDDMIEFELDEESSSRAGYPIYQVYRFNAGTTLHVGHVSDLTARLEVNFDGGDVLTKNINIEVPATPI